MTREQLLHFLPTGGEVVEVGVAEGAFSRAILAATAPRRLHLIDPWQHQDDKDYAFDPANVAAGEQESRYQGVLGAFASEIAAGAVEVHRGFSVEVAKTFPDGRLDWVYIDAMHTYQAVAADLEAFWPKLKNDGFILGHDYTNSPHEKYKFGVIEATNAFVVKHNLEFVALTLEIYPTYVLARSAQSPATQILIARLIYNVPGIVEIRDFPRARGFVHRVVRLGNDVRLLPSF